MNLFATIVEFERYSNVTYYSVQFEDSDRTETDKFFDNLIGLDRYREQVDELVWWIEEIGERGAEYDLFRDEQLAFALPPKSQFLREGDRIDVRLYFHFVSSNVIILFNGGVKTARSVQQCPNVRPHFMNAQIYIRKLQEIGIETDNNEITNIDELYFRL